METRRTRVLWVGETGTTKNEGAWSESLDWLRSPSVDDIDPVLPYDLVIFRWDHELRDDLAEWRAAHPEMPLAVSAAHFGADDARWIINKAHPLRFLTDGQWETELPALLEKAQRQERERRDRDRVMAEFSQRNRELEQLTDALERTVTERTGHLEESSREEKEKVARERQLIRFLSEMSLQASTEDILRVLRRELRRFHKVQNLVLALKEGSLGAEFFTFRGDQLERRDGTGHWPDEGTAPRELQQFFADHFGRPFHRALFFALDLHSAGQGLLAVEYSLMGDEEVRQISDLLQERLRSVAMSVERLFLEDRLRLSASRWERTFDGFRDPIAVIDTSMRVLRGNRAFSTGLSRRHCHEVFAASPRPCEDCPVAPRPEADHTLEGVIRVGRRLYRMSSWPVQEANATRIAGRVTHYADITESRELYLRLLQNEKMSAIGELAGHIAHELNNPLTGIRSLAQALKSEVTEEGTLKDDLSQIENGARRCQNIIRDLLEFTRGGEGPAVPVNVDEIVENTLPLLKSPLRRHRLELLLATRPAKIHADPHLLQQVVFNLVNNACQAMKDPGQIAIATTTRTDRAADGESVVEIRIRDTGPGIPPEVSSRLFEPFFTTKKEGEGTGLGLSTSKAIVERFGGQIQFRSEVGQGTEFTLRFPALTKEES